MATWDDVVAIATRYPEVGVSTSYGTPSLKVKGKLIARLRTEQDGGLALICTLEEKDALLQEDDAIFYTTPHYDGYGMILIRLEHIDLDRLTEMIEEAWLIRAPVRVRKEWEREHASD